MARKPQGVRKHANRRTAQRVKDRTAQWVGNVQVGHNSLSLAKLEQCLYEIEEPRSVDSRERNERCQTICWTGDRHDYGIVNLMSRAAPMSTGNVSVLTEENIEILDGIDRIISQTEEQDNIVSSMEIEEGEVIQDDQMNDSEFSDDGFRWDE